MIATVDRIGRGSQRFETAQQVIERFAFIGRHRTDDDVDPPAAQAESRFEHLTHRCEAAGTREEQAYVAARGSALRCACFKQRCPSIALILKQEDSPKTNASWRSIGEVKQRPVIMSLKNRAARAARCQYPFHRKRLPYESREGVRPAGRTPDEY